MLTMYLIIAIVVLLGVIYFRELFWVVYQVDRKRYINDFFKRKKIQFQIFIYKFRYFKYRWPKNIFTISIIVFDVYTISSYLIGWPFWNSKLITVFEEFGKYYTVSDVFTCLIIITNIIALYFIVINSNDSQRDFPQDYSDLIKWDYQTVSGVRNAIVRISDFQTNRLKDYIALSADVRFAMAKIILMNSETLKTFGNRQLIGVANEEVEIKGAFHFDIYKITLFDYVLSNLANDRKICDNFSDEVAYEISISEHTYMSETENVPQLKKLSNNTLDCANPLLLKSAMNNNCYFISYKDSMFPKSQEFYDLTTYLSNLLDLNVEILVIARNDMQKELVEITISNCIEKNDQLIDVTELFGKRGCNGVEK